MNLRCFNHPDYAAPVADFVQDILALRPCRPGHLAAAAITGIPPSSRHNCNLTDVNEAEYQCLLDLPDMQEVIDNSAEGKGERLTPSCDVAGLGEAFPPRRLVGLLRGVQEAGGSANVQSIGQNDWNTALSRIALEIRSHMADESQ